MRRSPFGARALAERGAATPGVKADGVDAAAPHADAGDTLADQLIARVGRRREVQRGERVHATNPMPEQGLEVREAVAGRVRGHLGLVDPDHGDAQARGDGGGLVADEERRREVHDVGLKPVSRRDTLRVEVVTTRTTS